MHDAEIGGLPSTVSLNSPDGIQSRLSATFSHLTLEAKDDSQEIKASQVLEQEVVYVPQLLPDVATFSSNPTREAYMSLVACFCVTFCTFGLGYAFPSFLTYYIDVLLPEVSTSAITFIGTVAWFIELILSMPAGILYDRGYGRISILLSSILFVFCLFMVSLCTKFYQVFLAQGVGAGLALACLYLPVYASVSQHFAHTKVGILALGIGLAGGGSVGGVCLPVLLNKLIPRIGFPWAIRVYAFVNLMVLGLANLLLRPFDPSKIPRDPTMKVARIKDLVKDCNFVVTTLAGCCLLFGYLVPLNYIQVFTRTQTDANATLSFYIVSIFNASGLLAIALYPLADQCGPFNSVTPVTLLCGILCFVWPFCTTTGSIIAFSVLYAVPFAAVLPLFAPSIASLSSNPIDYGRRSGVCWTVTSFFIAGGVPAISAVIGESPYNFKKGGFTAGAILLAGGAMLLFVRMRLAHSRGTWKV